MNILEKMSQKRFFSNSEQAVIDHMAADPNCVVNASVKELAAAAYTSPSTIVRLFKKLDCNSYAEFKVQFISAIQQQKNRPSIDANVPFGEQDTLPQISKNLEALCSDALQETLSLFDEKSYQKAIKKLNLAQVIDIYALGANLYFARDFQLNLMRIHKNVIVHDNLVAMELNAFSSDRTHVALVISYSGESKTLIDYCQILRKRGTFIICITSMGSNSISDLSHLSLDIVSREKVFSKIGLFSSKYSILMVLDLLYSGIYRENYEENQRLTNMESSFLQTGPGKSRPL